jgi:hypothetical protein
MIDIAPLVLSTILKDVFTSFIVESKMVNDIFEGPFVEFWNNYACGSPHDEHRSSGPRKVKLCLDQYNFVIKELPYLGLHNAQDFAQILQVQNKTALDSFNSSIIKT